MKSIIFIQVIFILGMVGACSKSTPSTPPSTETKPDEAVNNSTITEKYVVSGIVEGLMGSGLKLNNGTEEIAISPQDSSFNFLQEIMNGDGYDVVVRSQPEAPRQECSVENSTGTISGSDISDIRITCVSEKYKIKGVASGLNGETITLKLNGSEEIVVFSDGIFLASTKLEDGDEYALEIKERSGDVNRICLIKNGSGSIVGEDVDSIVLNCKDLMKVSWNHPLPHGNYIKNIIKLDDKLIAVGANGGLLTSTDGLNWKARYTGTLGILYSAASSGDQWLVVGANGILRSLDQGATWSPVSHQLIDVVGGTVFNVPSFIDIVWTGNIFVALMMDRFQVTTIYSSENGLDWMYRFNTLSHVSHLIWADGQAVAVGRDLVIFSSQNGVVWEQQLSPSIPLSNKDLTGIAYNGTKFVVSGENGIVISSDDTVNWKWHDELSGQFSGLSEILWDGSQFAILGGDNKTDIYTSIDAITWQHKLSFGINFDTINAKNGNIILAGEEGNIVSSEDYLEWSTRSTSLTEETLNDIEIWKQNQVIAVGESGTILSNINGDLKNSNTLNNSDLHAVVSFSDKLVVVGSDGVILASSDAENWFEKNSGTSNSLFDVVWSGSMFVAVGSYSTILTSEDGEVWEAKPLNFNNGVVWDELPLGAKRWIRSVHWSENGFIAVGDLGFVVTSQDGEVWNIRDSGIEINLTKITSGGDKYIAIGDESVGFGGVNKGVLLTSLDTINWTIQKKTQGVTVDVSWNGEQFFSVGYSLLTGATVMQTSFDGFDWVNMPLFSSLGFRRSFRSMKWLGGRLILAGTRGTIISIQ